MEIYLDHAATTPCLLEAAKKAQKVLLEDYGNPSSLHKKGMEAELYLKDTRSKIANLLKVKDKEILFTSGATESNNLAIIGGVLANRRRGNHIITTKIEHPSVGAAVSYWEKEGFEVTYVPVDEKGIVIPEAIMDALSSDTVLVSVMHVNNETGSIQPIEEIGQMIRGRTDNCLFHVDAVQSFGKIPIYPSRWNINFLSASGHKLHGPKGSGFLYVREKTKLVPLLYGGGQEQNLRSGTENVAAIAGLGEAVSYAQDKMQTGFAQLKQMREDMVKELLTIDGVHLNGTTGSLAAAHIINISIDGVGSEVMLHTLEDYGIYVSAGSACSSHKRTKSPTLTAMGCSDARMDSAIRISFSFETTQEEMTACIDALRESIPKLKKYQRK